MARTTILDYLAIASTSYSLARLTEALVLIGLFAAVGGAASGQRTDACQSRKEDKPAIDYRIRGGPTGGQTEWLVYNDGLVCNGHMEEAGRISKTNLQQLLGTVAKIGFFDLPKGISCGGICDQCMSYRLRIRSGKRKHTINACDVTMAKSPQHAKVLADVRQALPR